MAAKENYFQEPFKTIETDRLSEFIWQRIPDCWAIASAALAENPSHSPLQTMVNKYVSSLDLNFAGDSCRKRVSSMMIVLHTVAVYDNCVNG